MVECEGFICPLCMRDFRGVPQLEQHFQEEHSETTQSRFRSNLKTLFGKFKKRVTFNISLLGDDVMVMSCRTKMERWMKERRLHQVERVSQMGAWSLTSAVLIQATGSNSSLVRA